MLTRHCSSPLPACRTLRKTGLTTGVGGPIARRSCAARQPDGGAAAHCHHARPQISEVFQGNWNNTLKPCEIQSDRPSKRPWMVDVGNHYPGWYPGHRRPLPDQVLSLLREELALGADRVGSVRSGTANCPTAAPVHPGANGVGTVFPFKSQDAAAIGYPLLTTGTIDLLFYGDIDLPLFAGQDLAAKQHQSMRNAATWLEGWIDGNGIDPEPGLRPRLARCGRAPTGR